MAIISAFTIVLLIKYFYHCNFTLVLLSLYMELYILFFCIVLFKIALVT